MLEEREIAEASESNQRKEGAGILRFMRALESDDQKIALAVLEGMRLQKKINAQSQDTERLQKAAP